MKEPSKSKAAGMAAAVAKEIEGIRQKPGSGLVLVSATAKEGRRRADIEFSQAGTVIDFAEITQEQWELILDDPQLTLRPAKEERPAKDQDEPSA
ncbi:hypothetical protein [Bosea sp. BK604]|uniref:hypothetical protein n=1 Tax=Bosea sp. BK604 TaxID=2512180 RepID=UPI0010444FF5|nr:hypothetical protein [Bosea sp. BK604]TCR70518.1 hypothetical protein EV560_101925 [Bosea sp. BK604]